jgi:NADP-dependent 3-hydroxy acid dehydrogenase YdfG
MERLSPVVRTALITGASRSAGLGFAVARLLAEKNHRVILAARHVDRGEGLAAELRDAGHEAHALRLDLSDRSSIVDAAHRLTGTIECLDVLVNNASCMPDFHAHSALDIDPDALRDVVLDRLTVRPEVAQVTTSLMFEHHRSRALAPRPG